MKFKKDERPKKGIHQIRTLRDYNPAALWHDIMTK